MEIEIDEFHALQKQICDLQDCCSDWEKQALDYKAKNIALSGDLERTRKALDIIAKEFHKETMPDFAVIRDALKTALEQKEE